MTRTISAAFSSVSAAREAATLCRERGLRVALNRQRPAWADPSAHCPGSGVPSRLSGAVMVPAEDRAVLTVLTGDAEMPFVLDTVRRCGGKTIHEPPDPMHRLE